MCVPAYKQCILSHGKLQNYKYLKPPLKYLLFRNFKEYGLDLKKDEYFTHSKLRNSQESSGCQVGKSALKLVTFYRFITMQIPIKGEFLGQNSQKQDYCWDQACSLPWRVLPTYNFLLEIGPLL